MDGRRVTSHSCKCTLLSWSSKRGLPWEDRLVLGGHTSNVLSAMVYSRDSLGRPLRLPDKLLMEVRTGQFLPDATPSDRFPGKNRKCSGILLDDDSNFSYEPSLGFGDENADFPFVSQREEFRPAGADAASFEATPNVCKEETSETSWSLVGS